MYDTPEFCIYTVHFSDGFSPSNTSVVIVPLLTGPEIEANVLSELLTYSVYGSVPDDTLQYNSTSDIEGLVPDTLPDERVLLVDIPPLTVVYKIYVNTTTLNFHIYRFRNMNLGFHNFSCNTIQNTYFNWLTNFPPNISFIILAH